MKPKYDREQFEQAVMKMSNTDTMAMWLGVTNQTFRSWAMRRFFSYPKVVDWRAMERETGYKI